MNGVDEIVFEGVDGIDGRLGHVIEESIELRQQQRSRRRRDTDDFVNSEGVTDGTGLGSNLKSSVLSGVQKVPKSSAAHESLAARPAAR